MNKKKIQLRLVENGTIVLIFAIKFFNLFFPFWIQLKIWACLGVLFYYANQHYRHICMVNLAKCFPEKTESEIKALSKKTFYSLGRGVAEALAAWQMNDKEFDKIKFQVHGLEQLQDLQAQGHGVMVYAGHFFSMELVGRKILNKCNAQVLYKKYSNELFGQYVLACRQRHFECVERSKVKQAVLSLKNGRTLFYLPDQNTAVNPRFENFFNLPCSMTRSIERLLELTGAKAIFCYCYCDMRTSIYHIYFQKVDEPMTAAVYNRLLEQAVRQHPEQYFWVHRRFKTRPPGEVNNFYIK